MEACIETCPDLMVGNLILTNRTFETRKELDGLGLILNKSLNSRLANAADTVSYFMHGNVAKRNQESRKLLWNH